MTLQQLFADIAAARLDGDPACSVTGLAYHSQRIAPGEIFFAIRGWKEDGNRFIPEAVSRGAIAVASELPLDHYPGAKPPAWVQVPNVRRALALAAARFYGDPSGELRLVGITGTNGKTTTAFLTAAILDAAGEQPALFGTIEYRLAGAKGERSVASHTTPESLDLQRMLREVVRRGGQSAVMEVSSHALALERVTGCRFHTAVFTNLTCDHLDFHGDVESYYAAKEKLFLPPEGTPPPAHAVLNADDPRSADLRRKISGPVVTYGLEGAADVITRKWKATIQGIEFTAATPAGPVEIRSPLLGRHNVSNLLAAIAVATTLGVPPEAIRRGTASVRVPGRMEPVEEGQPFRVLVDYAHTEDALRALIASARELSQQGRVLLVFGCGGDRDRTKRPPMGMAAGACDWVVLTSDNPRGEDPLQILNDVTVGLQKASASYVVEPDRARAIERALREARAGDLVLIAGKGHETVQIIGDRRVPFDDREIARAALRAMEFGGGGA
ncbi:MAG: UDP-N-acetylmuramoyl-L-alanyl-D-glutamate--2,6-diaminopimelate ligase [Terriglobia bacterium]